MTTPPTPFLTIPAWTAQPASTRYPAIGAFDLAGLPFLGGVIGLQPDGAYSRGVVIVYWTLDAAGTQIVGTQGIHLASPIPSMLELRLLNRGPYCYLVYQSFVGPNPLAAKLFATDVGGALPAMCGDTLLFEDIAQDLGASATATVYPADYFAGQLRIRFDAVTPAGAPVPSARATIYGVNLTNDDRALEVLNPGAVTTTIVPMGTWFVVVWNPTAAAIKYTLAATPLVTN